MITLLLTISSSITFLSPAHMAISWILSLQEVVSLCKGHLSSYCSAGLIPFLWLERWESIYPSSLQVCPFWRYGGQLSLVKADYSSIKNHWSAGITVRKNMSDRKLNSSHYIFLFCFLLCFLLNHLVIRKCRLLTLTFHNSTFPWDL